MSKEIREKNSSGKKTNSKEGEEGKETDGEPIGMDMVRWSEMSYGPCRDFV